MSNNPESTFPAPVSRSSAANDTTSFVDRPGFRRCSSSGSTSSNSIASASTPSISVEDLIASNTAAAEAVLLANDRMGLANPNTDVVAKLKSIDRGLITDLVIPEDKGKGHQPYKGINNSCELSMNENGKDLLRNLNDAELLKSSIAKGEENSNSLKQQELKLRQATAQNLKDQAQQSKHTTADKGLLQSRLEAVDKAANKYVVAEWIKANPEPLAGASVEDTQEFTGLRRQEQVPDLPDTKKIRTLRVLDRLSWAKSLYMQNFDGKMVVKPRDVTRLTELMVGYICLAPSVTLQSIAASIMQQEAMESVVSNSVLPSILEAEEGDDDETLGQKRLAKQMVEELMARKAKKLS